MSIISNKVKAGVASMDYAINCGMVNCQYAGEKDVQQGICLRIVRRKKVNGKLVVEHKCTYFADTRLVMDMYEAICDYDIKSNF